MTSSSVSKRKIMCQSVWLRRQRSKTNSHGSKLSLATTPCQEAGDNSDVAENTIQVIELDKFPEAFNNPASPCKFLQLRHLKIHCCSSQFESFDFLSLISFLEACLALESFFLSVSRHYYAMLESTSQKSDVDSWHIKKVPGFRHHKLKKASITGISSSKSLIELTCQILENSSSLECLVLDTTNGYDNSGICRNMERRAVMEALRGVKAIERHVEWKVPSSVSFKVLKPCDRCHMSKL